MASKKAVLGRGLSALLPADSDLMSSTESGKSDLPLSRLYQLEDRIRLAGRIAEIEMELIRPNPYQTRKEIDEEKLEELAESIRQLGIIQPITVRSLGNGRYELITGERRWRAAHLAELERIPAYIREADSESMLEMALVENVQREELNPIDIAHGYLRLIEECNLTQEQVATKIGKNRVTVANMLRLLKLPPVIQASLRDGSISIGHARALINIESEEVQLKLFREIEKKALSVRQIEKRVRVVRQRETESEIEPKKAMALSTTEETDVDALQINEYVAQLRSVLGTQIFIKHKPPKGGKIEISYYSDEDLERLMEFFLNR